MPAQLQCLRSRVCDPGSKASDGLGKKLLASFPDSSAPKCEIEVVHMCKFCIPGSLEMRLRDYHLTGECIGVLLVSKDPNGPMWA